MCEPRLQASVQGPRTGLATPEHVSPERSETAEQAKKEQGDCSPRSEDPDVRRLLRIVLRLHVDGHRAGHSWTEHSGVVAIGRGGRILPQAVVEQECEAIRSAIA